MARKKELTAIELLRQKMKQFKEGKEISHGQTANHTRDSREGSRATAAPRPSHSPTERDEVKVRRRSTARTVEVPDHETEECYVCKERSPRGLMFCVGKGEKNECHVYRHEKCAPGSRRWFKYFDGYWVGLYRRVGYVPPDDTGDSDRQKKRKGQKGIRPNRARAVRTVRRKGKVQSS